MLRIDKKLCIQCYRCIRECPYKAISLTEDREIRIDLNLCTGCGHCLKICPNSAIKFLPGPVQVDKQSLEVINKVDKQSLEVINKVDKQSLEVINKKGDLSFKNRWESVKYCLKFLVKVVKKNKGKIFKGIKLGFKIAVWYSSLRIGKRWMHRFRNRKGS